MNKKYPNRYGKNSPVYLGGIAERVLSKFFDHIERMPYGNRKYDFFCGRGLKIDVKSSCIGKVTKGWCFTTNRNIIADYFLFLAFDDREHLTPMHVWLIPSRVLSSISGVSIANKPKSLARWEIYERPLDKVVVCCNSMRR